MSFRLWVVTLLTGSRMKALVAEGARLFQAKQHVDALESYREVVRRWPGRPEGYEGMADCYQALGLRLEARREAAIAEALDRLNRKPDDLEARMQLAKGLMDKELYGKAAAQIEYLLKNAPHTAELLKQAAHCYRLNRNYPKAIEPLQRLLRMDPMDASLHEQLGKVLHASNRNSEAKRALDMAKLLRAVAADPGNPEIVGQVVEKFLARSQFKMARAILDKAINSSPNNPALFALLGGLQLDNREVKEAVGTLTAAVNIDPTNSRAHRLLAKAYKAEGNEEKAFHHLSTAKNLDEANQSQDPTEAALVKLKVFLQSGRMAEAKQIAEFMAKNFRTDWRTPFAVGLIRHQEGQLEKALALLREAEKRFPDSAELNLEMGMVYSAMGDTQRAVASVRNAVRLNPRDLDTRLAMAEVLRSHGMIEAAVQEEELADSLRQSLQQRR